MLFIGFFSFDEIGSKNEIRHGYFSCVADSDSAENAVKEFKKYLRYLKDENNIFEYILKIYIEDIVRIEKVPSRAIIMRLQSAEGQFPKSISYSLPSVNHAGIEAFGWAPEMEQATPRTEEYIDAIPFIEFE